VKINQNTKETNRSTAGFTLIESAVALTIGAIMLTSLYGAFVSGFATVKTNRENMRATQIMVSRLEGIRLCTFGQLTNSVYNPTTFTESFDPKDDATHTGGVIYNGTYSSAIPTVGSLPDSYRTNVLLVTLSVNWTSGNMQHSRSMQTYAARDGIANYVSFGR
jgi:prepilin-type N-terminal cleavage/methylation domain-containing protein